MGTRTGPTLSIIFCAISAEFLVVQSLKRGVKGGRVTCSVRDAIQSPFGPLLALSHITSPESVPCSFSPSTIMSGPRNNLDDILKKRQHSSTATTAISTSQSQSQDAAPKVRSPYFANNWHRSQVRKPKFRVASKPSPSNTQKPAGQFFSPSCNTMKSTDNVPAQPLQKTSSATSFATPGFGKKKPAPLNPVSNSPVVVTSTETSPTSGFEKRGEPVAGPITQAITSVPTKRNSPFTDPPSKRPRSDARTASDKENFDTQPIEFDADSEPTQEDESDASIVMVSHRDKGKGREIPRSLPPPPSSQRNIDFSQISTPSRPQGRDARSIVSGSSSRRAHAFSITTTSANTITSASARIGSSSTQYSSVTLPDGVAEDNQNNALRHLILDYSDMLTVCLWLWHFCFSDLTHFVDVCERLERHEGKAGRGTLTDAKRPCVLRQHWRQSVRFAPPIRVRFISSNVLDVMFVLMRSS